MLEIPLNLFYDEPDPDRWLPWDRFPRRVIRRLLRGKPRVSGQRRVFLNLCAGLDLLGVAYRVNDYRYAERHPEELACVVGQSHLLEKIPWRNPILLGASLTGHPMDDPNLLKRLPVRKILVPGEWLRKMYVPYYGATVAAWPVGIDTEKWKPAGKDSDRPADEKKTDFLIYDKIRWEHNRFESALIQPIRDELNRKGLTFHEIRYGFYREEEFEAQLRRCKAMIFLCEHETQGIAYQQALACGVPILAWDRGGFWQDPTYYPQRFRFQPVSSVPYWEDRCGVKFDGIEDFGWRLDEFCENLARGAFAPRDFILENLTLEHCARLYVEHCRQAREALVR